MQNSFDFCRLFTKNRNFFLFDFFFFGFTYATQFKRNYEKCILMAWLPQTDNPAKFLDTKKIFFYFFFLVFGNKHCERIQKIIGCFILKLSPLRYNYVQFLSSLWSEKFSGNLYQKFRCPISRSVFGNLFSGPAQYVVI